MSQKPAIVIVAFNRVRSLERLLQGIAKAQYPQDEIPLIISIDRAVDNHDVLHLAEAFQWMHGKKEVVYQNTNLGLRKHVLQCAGYALTHGAVIVLEDDLYVAPNFYAYAAQALEFSKDKPYIGGISLYSHQFNVHSRAHFSPLLDGYDNWYFQFASSWGQAWTKVQWEGFMEWYGQQGPLLPKENIPQNVTRWSDKSWLKYFIAYLIENDTYFLYPRTSYTTNFSDAGTHIGKDTTTFQVPLDFSAHILFRWSTLEQSGSIYDAFFENKKLHHILKIPQQSVVIDLYGAKPLATKTEYLLTDKILSFKVLKSYGRSLKPHDANIMADIPGEDIFLYDCQVVQKNARTFRPYRKIIYNIKSMTRREAKQVFFYLLKEGITKRVKQLGWGK